MEALSNKKKQSSEFEQNIPKQRKMFRNLFSSISHENTFFLVKIPFHTYFVVVYLFAFLLSLIFFFAVLDCCYFLLFLYSKLLFSQLNVRTNHNFPIIMTLDCNIPYFSVVGIYCPTSTQTQTLKLIELFNNFSFLFFVFV